MPEESEDKIPLGMNLSFFCSSQPDAGKDKECPEHIDDPMKMLDKRYPRNDEDCAHDKCAYDSPEEYFVLIERRDFEIG